MSLTREVKIFLVLRVLCGLCGEKFVLAAYFPSARDPDAASYPDHMPKATPPLPRKLGPGRLLDMHFLARLLQLAGLVIPPMAMGAQLSQTISTGRMLQFLMMALGLFVLGYALQRYSGGGQ